jgi:hypothetical protein
LIRGLKSSRFQPFSLLSWYWLLVMSCITQGRGIDPLGSWSSYNTKQNRIGILSEGIYAKDGGTH